MCPLHLTRPLQGAVGCHCAAPGEHSGAKGLAQGPRVVICGIQTWPLVSPLERKPPVLTTRPPLSHKRAVHNIIQSNKQNNTEYYKIPETQRKLIVLHRIQQSIL
ncbi:hypothetical protein AMECASPLE_011449 [Ameca splendens]|uniref:Uncharacterized protein n=1 Tax=Ameca splendens TaxID=208324 RepID=A0ABV0ZN32_9TELE